MNIQKLVKKIGLSLLMVLVLAVVTACGSSLGSKESSTATDGTEATSDTSGNDTTTTVDEEVSDTLKALREKGTLVVGSSGDIFAYIDETTGEFEGIDAVIIKEAAKRLGIENVEMSLIPFSELILNLNSKNIDLIADGMYITAERSEQICYGEVWYTQGGGLVVPEDSTINGQDDFDPSSTTIGYTTGTIWQGVVEGWESEGKIKKAVATGDQTESLVALQYGKIDAFLTDSTVVENLFSNSPETVEGLRLCDNYSDTETTIGHIAPSVRKGDEKFMEELNAVIVEMRDDGFLEQAFKDCGLDPELHMITNDERVYTPAE